MQRQFQMAAAIIAAGLIPLCVFSQDRPAKPLNLTLQSQSETSAGSGRFHIKTRQEQWKPEETAIIVCDVWDLHHCLNAVRRLEEFAPRLNAVLKEARSRGVTIIHSPSDCMPAYEKHLARLNAKITPEAKWIPHDVKSWCSVIPTEERAAYPIDQSDGGEDDDPEEHAKWVAHLKSLGRNPGTPWKKQSDLIEIDPEKDFISDRGDEVWNVLESRNIRNVILTGVHLNMCVLGRPFGLRQMARNGKNVVLMRDMTDTMYNPDRWPFVDHHTGTDLVVSHVERFVCPTMTSDQIIGGVPFRFKGDFRRHLVVVMAEDEYETDQTLPQFVAEHLNYGFKVTQIFGSDEERNSIPNFSAIKNADAVLISIRRRVLPTDELQILRDFVASGKPVIGIRTASHAFSLRGKKPPEGYSDWLEFDAQVFGGNYHGHLGNKLKSTVTIEDNFHLALKHLPKKSFEQGYSLYNVMPLARGTTVLARATAEGHPTEPVAWTFQRPDGGRSFYTSLGHPKDFANRHFKQLLVNGIQWVLGRPRFTPWVQNWTPATRVWFHWVKTRIPSHTMPQILSDVDEPYWLRCVVRVPHEWKNKRLVVEFGDQTGIEAAWLNGKPAKLNAAASVAILPADAFEFGEANLLTLRLKSGAWLRSTPSFSSGNYHLALNGTWEARARHEEYDARLPKNYFSNMPLPSKFGGGSDIVFSPSEPLWVARPVTMPGQFTGGIEGPACDKRGNIFAVNFGRQGTIGQVTPSGVGGVFVTLPEGSVGNGIRFDKDGTFFVADYSQHNILHVDPKTKKVTTLAHNPKMNQPNDLAIGPDGTLWASDPNWAKSTGQIWRIDRDGTTTLVAPNMGTTNGIEVSPDGKTLYVNESVQRNIWAFTITKERTLTDKRLFKQFEDHGFDGHRCDVDGNLYVTRYGKGTVVKLSPKGELLQEINVLGKRPSNLCFGGPDGCTIYVTEVESTRLVAFRADRPGASWNRKK